ncbi:DUF7282 domain-containing protein [Halorussus pelagicus]|uniref:DUF7282 domain-containing protein n=1 Tax=Halorussus pelagicus TaxID=2505977 RepID=UPI000FFB6F12|nr:hypothetical protein [Halorussus pelagicus]
MTPSGGRRRTAAIVLVTALVVSGAGVVVTGAPSSADESAALQETTTTAEPTASVSLENLSSPERVSAGTNYTVSATVVNRGDELVTEQVSYRITGNVIAATFVDVPANETRPVQFNVTGEDTAGFPAGTFTHGVFVGDAAVTANLTLVNETAETTTEATPAENETTITFERQTSNGSAVTVQSVTIPEGGFVVVHDNGVVEGEVVESILGVSDYVEPGAQENVTVELDPSLTQSQQLVAIAYRDSNDNQEFDLVTSNRTADGPYTQPDSREAVNGIAVVDVTDGSTNETTDGTSNETTQA